MGDLVADTELTDRGDGSFERVVHRDWEIWGPNGGYMAALALRAANVACGRSRPANASVHFLGVANFDESVVVRPVVQRVSRVATSVGVSITQADRPILQAMVWAIDDGIPGLEHELPPADEVGHWSHHPTIDERWATRLEPRPQGYAFWRNFEERPTEWIDDWEARRDLEPVYRNWLRFRHVSDADPWSEAARLMLLVDLGAWPAASRTHLQDRYIAPSIDVSCEFHSLAPHEGWYLLRGESPVAGEGLVASHQEVRDSAGRLLASGISHLLCRPVR